MFKRESASLILPVKLMKYFSNILVPLVLLAVFPAGGNSAATAVDFLRHGVGARATGMGEAFVGVYSGVSSAFWNPAGLSDIKRPELGFMHGEILMDTSLEFIGYARPVRSYGVFAVNGIFLLTEPLPETDPDTGAVIGEIDWFDTAIAVSYAGNLRENISAGLSLKLVYQAYSDSSERSEGTAYGLDCGIIYRSRVEGLDLGLAVLNTGTQLQMSGEVKKDDLPRTVKAGLAYEKHIDKARSLLLACDLNSVLEGSWHFGAGAELNIGDMLFIRTGFFEREDGISGITYGFGYRSGSFGFDFSNVPSGGLVGYTRSNKISFDMKF